MSNEWKGQISRDNCLLCANSHSFQFHYMLFSCPLWGLRHYWTDAWGEHLPAYLQWLGTASPHDRFLMGRWLIPQTLWNFLVKKIGKISTFRAIQPVQKAFYKFWKASKTAQTPAVQRKVASKRQNPYQEERYDKLPKQQKFLIPEFKSPAATSAAKRAKNS